MAETKSELEKTKEKLAKCERLRDAATDPRVRYYYEQCAAGHRRTIEKVEQCASQQQS